MQSVAAETILQRMILVGVIQLQDQSWEGLRSGRSAGPRGDGLLERTASISLASVRHNDRL